MSSSERSVLIVEDEADLRDLLVELIQDLGVNVQVAHNGKAALEVLTKQRFDAVLTDVRMPEMTGIELMAEVRKRNLDASFVMLTGTEDRDCLLQAIRLGAVDYLKKPLSAQEVTETLTRAIDIGNRRRKIAEMISKVDSELGEQVKQEERMISLLRVYNNAQNKAKKAA